MKYFLAFFIPFVVISLSFSQTKNNPKNQSQTNVKQTINISTSTQTQISNSQSKTTQNKNVEKQNNEDYSQSEVLVDKMNYETDNLTYSESEEPQAQDPDALPYAYGQIKGVLNTEGKSVLVFEGDDGTINFIYVYNDKGKMKWKLYGKIKRSY